MALTNSTPYDDNDDDTTKDSSIPSRERERNGDTRQDSWEFIDEVDAVDDAVSDNDRPTVPSKGDEAANGVGAVHTTDEAAAETNHDGQVQVTTEPAVTTAKTSVTSNVSTVDDGVRIAAKATSDEGGNGSATKPVASADEASDDTFKLQNQEDPFEPDVRVTDSKPVKTEDANSVLKSDESLDELEMPRENSKADERSDDPNLSMLSSMGFDFQQSKLALAANEGNLEKAVESLLAGDYDDCNNGRADKAFEYEAKIDAAMMYDSSDPWSEISTNQGMDGDYIPIPTGNARQSRQQQQNGTWTFLESTLQDLDDRHQLRQRTKRSIANIHQSSRHLWTDLAHQTQSLRSTIQTTCDDADAQARHRARCISHAASSAKDSVCRANSEYKIAEKVATVAVVGGATLIALGNPRLGAGALAAAGATLAVGEVLKGEEGRGSCCTFTRDVGLREGVLID
ncbi:hypothetical protein ACHAXS_011237 [Conticribra weissflogii]